MPWMTEVRPRLPSASVYSDQPTKSSSVVTFRNEKCASRRRSAGFRSWRVSSIGSSHLQLSSRYADGRDRQPLGQGLSTAQSGHRIKIAVLPTMRNGRAFPSPSEVDSGIMIKLTVNGQEQTWDGDPSLPLLWYLRDEIGLTGTKFGCGKALCGACTSMSRARRRVPASPRYPMLQTRRSPRSRGLTRTAIIRCRKPGARSMYRNGYLWAGGRCP